MEATQERALWRMGFRPFFLGGAGYAVLFMAYWSSGLYGLTPLGERINTIFFHIHEWVYGFGAAIIAGFLLTASANWSGVRGIHGKGLIGLFALWCVGRVGIWMPLLGQSPAWAWLSALFLPALGIALSSVLWPAKKWNNTAVVFWIGLLWLGQILYLLELSWLWMGWGRRGLYLGLHGVVFLMVMIGGRILPYFTKNALQAPEIEKSPLMDRLALGSTIFFVGAAFALGEAHLVTNLAALAAGITGLARMYRWGTWKTFKEPLLWILHLAYLWIIVGFFLHFFAHQLQWFPASISIHAFAMGGMGCFILGMLSRVALGHTGRPLVLPPLMRYAYLLVLLAAFLRVTTTIAPGGWFHTMLLATGAAWILAYSLFLYCYTGILLQPRPDGKPS